MLAADAAVLVTSRAFVDDLDGMLDAVAVPRPKQWWERYLKVAAAFRGVGLADTSRVVNELVACRHVEVADPDRCSNTLARATGRQGRLS